MSEIGAEAVHGERGAGMTVTSAQAGVRLTGSPRASAGSFDFSRLDAVAQEIAARQDTEEEQIDFKKLSRAEKKALKEAMEGSLDAYPHLMALKPRERYLFRSDYYQVDDEYSCILNFFHNDEAQDEFPVFWGINRIPHDLGEGVTAVVLEQVSRRDERWVDEHLKTSDRLDKLEHSEQGSSGSMSTKRKAAKVADDMRVIVNEIHNGASYLQVHNRLLLRAPSLTVLDEAVEKIKRLYIDRFSTLHAAPHHGEQRQELSTLFSPNKAKRGKGFHYTSTEYAGSYSLVTNGLNDASGEYVGYMEGDVNNSAVLFDVDGYRSHIVCADSTVNPASLLADLRPRMVDLWGSKISQAALLNNARVVHLVLNGAPITRLGPPLESMTSTLDMTSGDVNMFEVFGFVDDELSLFPTHVEKLVLMAEQALGASERESLTLLRGKLREILTDFYVDQGMWAVNAKENRDRLRLVGIPHREVPLLQVFITYLDTARLTALRQAVQEEAMVSALSTLQAIFRNLLDSHGDLFNEHTSDKIDSVSESRRVIYDFSGLMRRGTGVAMAQLVNVVSFAVESLGMGDTVIIHGAQAITNSDVQNYMATQFGYLESRGGRVAYLYDDIDAMLDNHRFNRFNRADYTLLGPMGLDSSGYYQQVMNQSIPGDMARLISLTGAQLTYLRRGSTNVVFRTDLALGLNPVRKQRRELASQGLTPAQIERELQKMYGRGTGSARDVARGGGTASGGVDSAVFNELVKVQQADLDKKMAATGEVARLEKEEQQQAQEREKQLGQTHGGASAPGTSGTTAAASATAAAR